MRLKRTLSIALALLMLVALVAGCSDPNEPETTKPAGTVIESQNTGEPEAKKKMAWICESILTDGGWNENGFAAIQELAEKYDFELSYQEDVTSADVADVLRNYAASGYDMVISNEQYHCEDMAAIAPEFPDVVFGCVNGYVSADNMIAVTGDMWQHIYLAGVMSGGVTESNKIGLITFSTDSDSALTMAAAYGGGAKAQNPDVELIHVATGSFSDLAIGKEMAISLIGQGCDVIFCNSGDTNETVMDYCIENEVYTVSAIVDRNNMSDEYVLGSALLQPSDILSVMIDGYMDGTLQPSSTVHIGGIEEGIEAFVINPDIIDKIDQSILDAVDTAAEVVMDGKVTFDELSAN